MSERRWVFDGEFFLDDSFIYQRGPVDGGCLSIGDPLAWPLANAARDFLNGGGRANDQPSVQHALPTHHFGCEHGTCVISQVKHPDHLFLDGLGVNVEQTWCRLKDGPLSDQTVRFGG